jgi:hypothetical protein
LKEHLGTIAQQYKKTRSLGMEQSGKYKSDSQEQNSQNVTSRLGDDAKYGKISWCNIFVIPL